MKKVVTFLASQSRTVCARGLIFVTLISLLTACSPAEQMTNEADGGSNNPLVELEGQWIVDINGAVMPDPQTSGLVFHNNQLLTVSDASALPIQRRRIHAIDPVSMTITDVYGPMTLASRVRRSCFAQYLSDEPDYEALVVDPDDPNVFILVTEDATRSGAMSTRCQQRYENTGSTAYPTLLVKVVKSEDNLRVTHVRPIQYPLEYAVGDFPNDGIEGMAFGPERTLYLGLEKDSRGQPRIFSVVIDAQFWQTTDFAAVTDPQLDVPSFTAGNHPINGMDYLPLAGSHPGLLIAAARNDEQLWFIDLAKQQPTQIIDLVFLAPSLSDDPQCKPFEKMDNASLEGVAVVGADVWLINDPWKRNYHKNIQCESNRQRYEAMAPLMFKLTLQPEWLRPYFQAKEASAITQSD
ncbi:hypothetical protein QTP81_12695 [Alteromonas sp. ASW11-36]|uniref:Phytase-like domain-containing protein n=1 Tax=Alteromonas arenosi TaxID=3055817 RepID=A0ABT7T0X0_9ALTE|nr:hypothetical protein [Alteromonas sp. ASW11-36]MDM7861452.1 hypothetical protein [Alteromonas sp. ASW11-36]